MLFRAGLRSLGYRVTSLQGRVARGLAIDAPRRPSTCCCRSTWPKVHILPMSGCQNSSTPPSTLFSTIKPAATRLS